MTILAFILTLFACAVSVLAGAYGMRFVIERNREIAEQEDPRDTQIRNLQAQIRLAASDQTRDRATAVSATEHVELAHDRIIKLLNEARELKVDSQHHAAVTNDDDDEKELLRNKLSAANAQLDTLRRRNQELELENSLAGEADMLSDNEAEPEADDGDADPFSPADSDDSPSLIQALTGELDRWKHHCHVLGGELKTQRQHADKVNKTVAEMMTMPDIDELTDIRGIGAVLARKLHQLGIYRYENLLNLSADDVERAQQLIPDFERRMERDAWLEQARSLHDSKARAGLEHVASSAGA